MSRPTLIRMLQWEICIVVELSEAAAEAGRRARAIVEFAGDPWLVWSNEHRAWFADPGFMMHRNLAAAFRFSKSDADHLVAANNVDGDDAVAISLIDAITRVSIEGMNW